MSGPFYGRDLHLFKGLSCFYLTYYGQEVKKKCQKDLEAGDVPLCELWAEYHRTKGTILRRNSQQKSIDTIEKTIT